MMGTDQPLELRTETLDRCPVCGGDKLRRILTAPDHESHSGEYGIDECAGCGIAFTNPRPLEQELPKLYEQRSSADFAKMSGFAQRLRGFAIDRYLARQLGKWIAGDTRPIAILDYGCGDGALVSGLLRLSRRLRRPLHVTAVDFHEVAPPALADTGSTVSYQVNAAWHRNPGHYDVIFLRHVLEHHPQPLRLLSDLARALRPGGKLFVEVPNRRSAWARIFGSHYFAYYLPRHLFHFDRASLADVLRRATFVEVSVRLAHHPIVGGSLRYLTGIGSGNTSVIGLAMYPMQVTLDTIVRCSTALRASASRHPDERHQ
jgi:2-polyprenyl-3-methyl-5-hydroxy-6-metoxy-1,4-benzoquinol methylase